MNERIRIMQRQPRRVSITLSHQVHEDLLSRSEEEGRSLSNLCAFLLEQALCDASRLVADGKDAFIAPPRSIGDGHRPLHRDSPSELWRQRS